MNLSRIRRLLTLIGLLQAGRGCNADGLAQACHISRRTVFRDLDVLRQAGVPLVFDEQNRHYRIPSTYFLPPTNFTPEEALALIVLCHELGSQSQLPFFAAARSAVVKLESSLPARLREHVRRLSESLQIQIAPINRLESQQPIYNQLIEAAAEHRAVRIHYNSLTEEEKICTRLQPYRLLFSRRSWYVIGRSSLHSAVRTFNVGRILGLEILDDHFEVPRGFCVERYLGNAWHLIPEPGPDHDVRIRFARKVAHNVAEVAWHRTQRMEFQPDGSLDYRVTVSGLNEIAWWILGYGDQAEVLEPTELRQLVVGHAARMLQKYDQGLGDGE
jgi:proteasome accessory factor B